MPQIVATWKKNKIILFQITNEFFMIKRTKEQSKTTGLKKTDNTIYEVRLCNTRG